MSLSPTRYSNPVRLHIGSGSLGDLGELSRRFGPRLLVVGDGRVLGLNRLRERLKTLLDCSDECFFDRIEGYPGPDVAQAAVDAVRRNGVEWVVGIGGGSALDVAKIAAAMGTGGCSVDDVTRSGRRLDKPGLPSVLIPTTAGTGSEVTRWSTLWDRTAGRKLSIEGLGMYAHTAILDAELTVSLPTDLTALTGADALSHAMEAFWNKNANPISDGHSLRAVGLLFEALPLALSSPTNLERRSSVLLASLLAGLAFSNTKTAAAHSLSYPMTLRFGVPHGQASSITLPALLAYNAETDRERMLQLAHAIGGTSIESGCRRIEVFLQRIGLKTRLSDLGIDAGGRSDCAAEGVTPDRAGNNLRHLDVNGATEILERIA